MRLKPGDRVKITGGAGYRNEKGVVIAVEASGATIKAPDGRYTVLLDDLQPVSAYGQNLLRLIEGCDLAYKLAIKCARSENALRAASCEQERQRLAEEITFNKFLLDLTLRIKGVTDRRN